AKKTKKLRFKNLFRPPTPPVKEEVTEVNLSLMKKLATTKEQEDVLERIEHETIQSVRDAWIEHFFKISKRSQCKGD
ncbi:unnamed protein product, partial [marine sediment metagenome]